MATNNILLPNESVILQSFAVLVNQTPGNVTYRDHLNFMTLNGANAIPAYMTALNTSFVNYSSATLAKTMLDNLGLNGFFTLEQATAYLNGNSSNRVAAMVSLSNMLLNYVGTDTVLLAAKAAYAAKINTSYEYSLVTTNTSSTSLDSVSTDTFVLTTGVDVRTAHSFLASETYYNVDGKGPTLNAGDQLTGIAGKTDNTLTITDLTPNTGAVNNAGHGNIPAGVTLTNIQNIVLNTSNNTATGTGFSTVGYADVRNLTVTTNGDGADLVAAKNGTDGTAVTVGHNGYALGGTLNVVGGTDVTATSNGGSIYVGKPLAAARVPLASELTTGAIVINQNGTGAGAVQALGGSSVTITTSSSSNTGAIDVGNTTANTGNNVAGRIANTAGNVTVNTAGTGAVTIFGGKDVTIVDTAINNAGAITVGDVGRVDASNLPTGNVAITETARIAYNGLAGSSNNNQAGAAISVYGGVNVAITTNAANAVNVGNLGGVKENILNPTGTVTVTNTGVSTGAAAAAVLITGGTAVTVTTTGANVTIGRSANAGVINDTASNPTGNVTVTETMNGAGLTRAVVIDGGNDVTVTAKGQNVTIGSGTNTAGSAPKGAVLVNQADVFTGNTNAVLNATNPGDVAVYGGTTVTVNTTGGNVTVGGVVGGTNTVPSGDVNITRTFGGVGADTTWVQGGAVVNITTTKTSGTITVGANSTALIANGTALKDANLAPTGNVTIVNATTVGSTTVYGTGVVNVNTNGATTVSVKGGDVATIADIQSTLATGGSNSGKAVGVSKLATVVIDGLQAANGVAIQSDALTALTLTTNKVAGNTITITNNTAAHDLTLTQGGNTATATVVDANAGKVTVTDNGTASAGVLTVAVAKATELTVNNAAAASLNIGSVITDIAKVTLKGAGATTFAATDQFGTGNLSKAMIVDATNATGNVTASIKLTTLADTTQQYLGGSGVDTLTIDSNASGWGNLAKIDGGNGTADVLVANYAATGTDVALGSASSVKNFEIIKLGALATGAYDASVFTGVQVGAVTDDVTVNNAASGATLSVLDNTGDFKIGFAGANTTATNNALTINLGAGSKAIKADVGAGTGTDTITANGYEALTVNAVGKTVTAGAATVGDTATIDGVATNGAATLTVGGAADLTLTSNVGFSSINASGNTGSKVDVSAVKVSNSATTFTGGAAKLVAAGSTDQATLKALVTIGGTGTVLTAGQTLTVNINGTTFVYTAPAAGATAAAVAADIAAAINAQAATGTTTGNTLQTGAAVLSATGATASGGYIVLNNPTAAPFEVLTSKGGGVAATTTIADSLLGGQQQDLITVITNAGTFDVFINGVEIGGAAIAAGASAAATATAIAAAITAASPLGISSAVAVGATVLVTSQLGQTNLVSVTNAGGAGSTVAETVNMATVNNTFVTGTGGGEYKAGLGGSWNTVTHKFSSGSETVTLDASTAKTDTLVLKEGAVVTDNNTSGGVTKFIIDSQSASDVITFRNTADGANQAKTILKNAVVGVVNTVNGAAAMANVLDPSGALNAKLANLTYVISNGVITFSATGGHSLTEFTRAELISAAEILVSSSTTGGANMVAAFSYNGRSYVVSSDTGAAGVPTLAGAGATNDKSVIVELKDVASVKGFGSTFGEGTIVSNTVTNLTGSAANNGGVAIDLAALAASSTLDYTGFAIATLAVPGTVAANTNTTIMTKLAASAELVADATAVGSHLGLVSTSQVGTSGHNSLTVNAINNAVIFDRLTVNGDALVKFVNGGVNATVTELVDATNTMNTVQVGAGTGSTTLLKIAGTALTTVDAVSATGDIVVGTGTLNAGSSIIGATGVSAIAQDGVTFKLATGTASTIYASGSGDTFTQGSATTSGIGAVKLLASGGSNTITLSNGTNEIVANGAGDTISVGTGANTIIATGANDTFNIASGAATTVTIGTNATVNIGTAGAANVADTILVNGAVTGATADAAFAKTVLTFATGVAATGNVIDFDDAAGVAYNILGATVANSQVNVAGVTTLTDALNLAANYALLTNAQGNDVTQKLLAANTAVIDWFQFGGDTYVVAAVNNSTAAAQQTGLDANDIVVKITGLVDLTGSTFNVGAEALTL